MSFEMEVKFTYITPYSLMYKVVEIEMPFTSIQSKTRIVKTIQGNLHQICTQFIIVYDCMNQN